MGSRLWMVRVGMMWVCVDGAGLGALGCFGVFMGSAVGGSRVCMPQVVSYSLCVDVRFIGVVLLWRGCAVSWLVCRRVVLLV